MPRYAADSSTLRALSPPARRRGVRLALASTDVWCDDPQGSGRPLGTVVRLELRSRAAERAEVHWTATCLLTQRGELTPAAFGESGIYEVVRDGRGWRVSRALARFAH